LDFAAVFRTGLYVTVIDRFLVVVVVVVVVLFFRYLFEGVGFLVSSILISNISEIKRINQNGIKKMCRNIFAIQQNLTNITMSREGDLDRARQYYELLYSNPEEILSSIDEQGAKFSQREYADLLSLQARSQTIRDNSAHEDRLKRLNKILHK